ncbi:hypothetical protein N7448_006265 [Penicillium atrosanguineum]|uniref:Uncharacterized protein n=1 Tax=Penicillium atrosanguineum TaxID=1132637 RepID=A0A9W9U2E6_9EURO|nr:uncharacterized protein N7443_010026 [Penicillium atrosanguineum]KAJ5132107.1 hypothetical protein N7448_006265 [Penicillium atrosanguineum]KAJ5137683.1 hypothetical protein N7526_003916 [Penicillium atrosanguineum]KAJ5289773.1 hypothetical protein N7443_010026 [Penicillium atrosanguineum]KAJ5307595.1 hypothetical protein N7476_008251 [Penicillium atrosanguineum]
MAFSTGLLRTLREERGDLTNLVSAAILGYLVRTQANLELVSLPPSSQLIGGLMEALYEDRGVSVPKHFYYPLYS